MSGGSIPAVGVTRALRDQKELLVRLVMCDMQELAAGFFMADSHHVVPAASDEEFLDRILAICRDEHIDVVFPIIDEELQIFADHVDEFAGIGVTVITNPAETVRRASDKWATFVFCERLGIATPKTLLLSESPAIEDLKCPLIIKPRRGRGSAQVYEVAQRGHLKVFASYVEDPIVQEKVEGPEYTIDILTTFDGQILSVVPRLRLETKAGVSVKGVTVKDDHLIEYGRRIAEQFALFPRGNIQCVDTGSDLILIEVNPKFAATLPFTVAAGVNMPLLLLKMCLGEHVSSKACDFEEGLIMLRHWQETYTHRHRP